MKIGQSVTYVDADGSEQIATVTALIAHGPSGFWRLGLGELLSVPHESDRRDGAGYWRLGAPSGKAKSSKRMR